MNRILKAYLKRLTNLSTRNKSLLLPGLPAEQFLDIVDTDFLLGKSCLDVVIQAVQKKARIALCDVLDPRLQRSNEVSKKLRKISRTETFIQEERGSQDLYMGYPFVKGKLADGTPIHAPLLFFPVTLRIDREQWCLFPREEAGISLNRSFALAYTHFNETLISDDVLEKSFDDFSTDFLAFRTELYQWLKTTPLRINFNQDLFQDKLIPFEAKRSSILLEEELNGELKLIPEAVLGIFPQSGSYLVPDYNHLIDKADSLHIPLIGEPDDREGVIGYPSGKIKEEDVLTPFAVDASQEQIILAAKSGKSIVVEGPPGSGKSQLICNLMADFAARGKRVLLVCQKRAALDVVFKRLSDIGMQPYTALIHDFKNDRADLYKQLASQIEQVENYRQQNYSLDAVFLERQFTKESRLIDKTVEELDAFRFALFDEKECGVSVKELYLTTNADTASIDLSESYKAFSQDRAEVYIRKLRSYCRYRAHIGVDHIWSRRKSFASYGMSEMRSIEKMLLDWPAALKTHVDQFREITGEEYHSNLLQERNEVLERLEDISTLINTPTTYMLFKAYMHTDTDAYERLSLIRQATDTVEGFIAEDGIESTLLTQDIVPFREKLRRIIETKKSSVKGLFWDWFGAEKQEIGQIAERNGLDKSLDGLMRLEKRVVNRLQLEGWLAHPQLLFQPQYIADSENKGREILEFFRHAESASDAVGRSKLGVLYRIVSNLCGRTETMPSFVMEIQRLRKWIAIGDRMEQAMSPFLLKEQIDRIIQEPQEYSEMLLSGMRSAFDSMVEMDRVWDEMNVVEQEVTLKTIGESDRQNISLPDDMSRLFENSLKMAWIGHIENKFPELRAVTSLKMQEWEEQIQQSILLKQSLSGQIVGIKLRENTYQHIEKNRLGNRVTYRELGHQVTKKRKIWPIRKLLDGYSEEVFSLVPCWMASPEAVSAIFPMQEDLFDLVIFDEASQCYAEYGIPAAFRGKHVVVAGDSKQLSPSDLYRVRFEERSEDETYVPALEIESLLHLATQSFNSYQLSGHYRSLSLDLIDFSNQYFYKNSLQLLWKNNANEEEAFHVVKLLKELGPSGKSVGVVTFNFFQQQLIQEVVEREGILVKDLFVKNIENVQGDERDIIIFSMVYAPDEKGKVSMNFGSFSMQGGENRLNVAITRARERIYFVTSLWPEQLNIEQSANEGPKLLKAYLQYALSVSEGKFKPTIQKPHGFHADWLLKNKFLTHGSSYTNELPFADITIHKEEAYKGVLLTDDDLYHRSKSAKEPHAYLPLLLSQKNWPYRRIFSREYWTRTINLDVIKAP